MSLAHRIIAFNNSLRIPENLPAGIEAHNPFGDHQIKRITEKFYNKYYNDNHKRFFIIGINPGRFGAAVTGLPFTDTKRLEMLLNEKIPGKSTHEPSSEFIYTMIDHLGGPEGFFSKFYINSAFPLTITRKNEKGKEVNYNYYDSSELLKLLSPQLTGYLRDQAALGMDRRKAVVLGTGKNLKAIHSINQREGIFDELIPLEHPRYIIQYRRKELKEYLKKYEEVLGSL